MQRRAHACVWSSTPCTDTMIWEEQHTLWLLALPSSKVFSRSGTRIEQLNRMVCCVLSVFFFIGFSGVPQRRKRNETISTRVQTS